MSKKHNKSTSSKDTNNSKNNNPQNINKSKTSTNSKNNNQSSNNSTDTSASDYRHDMVELGLLKDQLGACYTGILSYLFLIKATQESIDQIVIKYEGGDVDNLPNPAKDANLSTILTFFAILQFTRIAYYRFIQISNEYEEGTTDIHPMYRQEILYGLIISVTNMIDQRMRELRSPYSPVLTPFPG